MAGEGASSIVLVSGGMDSAVVASIACREGEPAFLHLQYGQRTEAREERAFRALADFFSIRKCLVSKIDPLARIGGSSLTDRGISVNEPRREGSRLPNTYVPFRNAHFLAAAVSWAEVLGTHRIYYGAVEEDSSGYPDCREGFVECFNRLITEGTRPETKIRIVAPLLHLSKREIVKEGMRLGTPFHLTWSCYEGEGDEACGRCESCILRQKGFREAGAMDPIEYRKSS